MGASAAGSPRLGGLPWWLVALSVLAEAAAALAEAAAALAAAPAEVVYQPPAGRYPFKSNALMASYLDSPGGETYAVIAARAGCCATYPYVAARVAEVLPWLAPQVASGDFSLGVADTLAKRQLRVGDVTPAFVAEWEALYPDEAPAGVA
ncbi:MAG TPA: hypothetical protein VIX86_04590 [Streptosporangiaceae bacterium]